MFFTQTVPLLGPLSPEQNKLVEEHLDWAHGIAAAEHKKLHNSGIDLDLCRSEAEFALIEAAQGFEGRSSFKTYARHRIIGRIQDLVRGKHAPSRFEPLTEETEKLISEGSDRLDSTLAHFAAGAGRRPRRKARKPPYSHEEEQTWQAWLPWMRFSADGRDPDYKALRAAVHKLTAKGCSLAFLLATAQAYAFSGTLLTERKTSDSRPKNSPRKRVAHIRSTQRTTVKRSQELV